MASHPLFFIALVLCILSISAENVFVSIDCGSSDSYQDENLIKWTGDGNYTKNGESHSVQSNNSISRALDTLRVFTTRRKNCYDIRSVKQGRVLVRASFNYGNYDNKSSPPTFDLQFDGNRWMTVQTSRTGYVFYELIYTMKNDSISVCVAQTRQGQFPFISAIEVRSLTWFMYKHVNESYPLLLMRRFAYGANRTIRYPDDYYDRIWTPQTGGNGLTAVHSDVIFDSLISSNDYPPSTVLKNAISPVRPNGSIPLDTGFPPFPIPVYMNWYFSEVAQLKSNETRFFQFYKNNLPFSDPYSPPYGNCTELYISEFYVSSNITLSLVPTNNSTLPPLINAMEVYEIGDALTNGTNIRDVAGLISLKEAFVALREWGGDPCLPAPYTWDWIDCSHDTIPRVTALFLGGFGLSGVLPDFSAMDALQTIDLHNNSLKGPIPSFLGTFPKRKILNLGNNQFNGSIPTSLSNKTGLNLVVTGNPNLCTSDLCPNVSDRRPSSSSSIHHIGHLQILIFFGTAIPTFVSIWFTMGAPLHYN